MKKSEIKKAEYNGYYANYIGLPDKNTEIMDGYYKGKKRMEDVINAIPDEKLT